MDQNGNLFLIMAMSTIFWSVLAGLAVKRLRLDARRMEVRLKLFYRRADRSTFSAVATSRLAIYRTLNALYGKDLLKIFLTALAASVILNAYILTLFYKDWSVSREHIESTIRRVIDVTSPEYSTLVSSGSGKEELSRAFKGVAVRGVVVYDFNTSRDTHLRELHRRFWHDFEAYEQGHDLSYQFTLARFFGHGLDPLQSRADYYLGLSFSVFFMVFGNSVIDSLALLICMRLLDGLFARHFLKALGMAAVLAAVAFLSLANYASLLRGDEATVVRFVAYCAFIGVLGYGFLRFTTTDLGPERKVEFLGRVVILAAICSFSFGMVYLTNLIHGGGPIRWDDDPDLFIRPFQIMGEWVTDIHQLTDPKAVFMSVVTIFPLICAASIAATIFTGKLIYSSTKEMFLASVLGNAKIAGGTYFTGFVTTIITSTYVVLWAIHLVATHLHKTH